MPERTWKVLCCLSIKSGRKSSRSWTVLRKRPAWGHLEPTQLFCKILKSVNTSQSTAQNTSPRTRWKGFGAKRTTSSRVAQWNFLSKRKSAEKCKASRLTTNIAAFGKLLAVHPTAERHLSWSTLPSGVSKFSTWLWRDGTCCDQVLKAKFSSHSVPITKMQANLSREVCSTNEISHVT